MDDFSKFTMLLPLDGEILDESGLFLEEPLQDDEAWSPLPTPSTVTTTATNTANTTPDLNDFANAFQESAKPPAAKRAKPATTAAAAAASKKKKQQQQEEEEDDEEEEEGEDNPASAAGGNGEEDKAKKRRQQIAAASRASRARRKRELDDLRDENKRLREERSQFLTKIGQLQMKVEHMRERGSTDMRVENELLRAQLEEHKRFVSCFKRLCDGAPSSLNAKHQIYKQGSDSAQAHVLGLISQSQHDAWLEADVPAELDIPFSNFSMHYKFQQEFGMENKTRRRLNVRVDALFPGMDATEVSEFFWKSFSTTQAVQRLYNVKGVEITQLADDMPDKDTKTVYYREKWEAPARDQDWVVLCNRKRRELPTSTLNVPFANAGKQPKLVDGNKVPAIILALSTTQHSTAAAGGENGIGPAAGAGPDKITSLLIQGCVCWNSAGDARLCCVFSIPDDVKMKAVESLHDVIDEQGRLSDKFGEVLKSFKEMMGESSSVDLI